MMHVYARTSSARDRTLGHIDRREERVVRDSKASFVLVYPA